MTDKDLTVNYGQAGPPLYSLTLNFPVRQSESSTLKTVLSGDVYTTTVEPRTEVDDDDDDNNNNNIQISKAP